MGGVPVVHPSGGRGRYRLRKSSALLAGREWSQTEGFAVVMALDRLAGPGWKRHAFGDGAKTVLEMIDHALDASRPPVGRC